MMDSKKITIELSIVVPMFNEAENVENTVCDIQETMKGFADQWELIFVNDGSTDNTLEVAREWETKIENLRVVSYPLNMGRGKALRTGFEHSRGRYIVSTDFDLSYTPDHILRIYNELKNNEMTDVVLGSAYMPGGESQNVPFKRLLVSKLGNVVLRTAFGGKYHTITCVLRGYKQEVINSIELESNGKEIHLEILSKLHALGYHIVEIPATLTSRKKGSSKFKFRATSLTHFVFALFERPIVLFGVTGVILLVSGLLAGGYLTFQRFFGELNPGRPLMYLTIILVLSGILILAFGFIAMQNYYLRKEIFRLQRKTRAIENKLRVE